jgi:hypothetical protein
MADIQTPAVGEFRDGAKHSPVDVTDDRRSRPVDPEGRASTQWWTLVLDGQHDWGSVDVSPTRYGVTRYRLVVFPPGIGTVERRLLRLWRAWPTWGTALWVLTQIVLGAVISPGEAFATSTIAYLAGGLFLFLRVADFRCRVRTLSVIRMVGYTDEGSGALFAEVKSLVAALYDADSQRDRGQSSPADHESTWRQVYGRLERNHLGPATR